MLHRRRFLENLTMVALAAAAPAASCRLRGDDVRDAAGEEPPPDKSRLNYVLASSLYGTTAVAEILSEVRKTGAREIDLWPRVHADQREQVEAMGESRFRELLAAHRVQLGMCTRFDLGPYGLQDEMKFLNRLGGRLIVTGAKSPKGDSVKQRVGAFVESMQPHAHVAEQLGVTIAIENHGKSLLETPDSLRYFAEFAKSPHLGIALAPYHLPQDEKLLAKLIEDLGPKLVHFYAWQYGHGCMTKLPKEEEMLQLPGRGTLDFVPLLAALKRIRYRGWTEVFMHPVPRGIPILDTTARVTAAVNEAREYLEKCLASLPPRR